MALHTPLQWAQRPATILITVPVSDAKDVVIKSLSDVLEISLKSGEKVFSSKTALFAEIIPEESSHVVRERAIEIKLQKKNQTSEYWPRLTKDKVKNSHITIDWGRWKDEDELNGKDDVGDFGNDGGMGGMGGAGGMGGMDMQSLLAQMGGMGGGAGVPDFGGGKADSDDEEDESAPPPLE